jgi:hypothetical protein
MWHNIVNGYKWFNELPNGVAHTKIKLQHMNDPS